MKPGDQKVNWENKIGALSVAQKEIVTGVTKVGTLGLFFNLFINGLFYLVISLKFVTK